MLKLKITLAFKRVTKDSGIIPKLISKWTKSKYYHVELIIDNIWVSVYDDGVKLNKLRPLSTNWDYLALDTVTLTDEQYSKFMLYLHNQEGKSYDFLGIFLSQVFPLKIDSDSKWFCSEIVTKLLQMLYIEDTLELNPVTMSPSDLFKLFNR